MTGSKDHVRRRNGTAYGSRASNLKHQRIGWRSPYIDLWCCQDSFLIPASTLECTHYSE